jgi:uncharacterized protein (TIGR01777 family)
MKILMTGSSGLLGSALIPQLTQAGHAVTRLVRTKTSGDEAIWNPAQGVLDPGVFDGVDAVVNLAGENISAGRWTSSKKKRMYESRVQSTRLLAETVAGLARPPQAILSASAVGYYGDRGEARLTERSAPGEGYLAELCKDWEQALRPAAAKGVRVVTMRFGLILTPAGGALAKLLTPFTLGVGGRVGSGRQYWSWIALDDVAGAVAFLLKDPRVAGPVNFTAPNPLTNAEFTRVLGKVLSRPAVFPIPGFMLRLALGEMTDPLLLASANVIPDALLSAGYRFRFDDLSVALKHLLRP